MTELSKTAAAAQKAVQRSQKREAKELTTEDRIRNIRNNVAANLYVPATEVALLLEQYDRLEEKRQGQLDIVLRELQQVADEEDAFLANDCGGLGWEQDPQVTAIREAGLTLKGKFSINVNDIPIAPNFLQEPEAGPDVSLRTKDA